MLVKSIPEVLKYEEVNGRSIYYKHYAEVLEGNKTIEEVMGTSKIQSKVITRILLFLGKYLDASHYEIFSNEVGLHISLGNNRSLDIAVFTKAQLATIEIDEHYFEIPPKIVFEIDIKADLDELGSTLNYFHEKTEQLLQFGVEKVIWITTDSRKVSIATSAQPWLTQSWDTAFELLPNLQMCVTGLMKD